MEGKADLILSGGPIWCGLRQGFAEVLAIKGGRILAAGKASDVAELASPSTKRLDLNGRLAIPAFHDAHMHLLPLGTDASKIDARADGGITSLEEILALIANKAKSQPPGTWVEARGYDHTRLAEARQPTRWDLDRAAPDHPVWLGRCCGHMGVANSKALELAGISRETPNPPGGVIVRENGVPTGLLQERAQELLYRIKPAPSIEEMVAAIELAGKRCLSFGIGSVMDACVGLVAGVSDITAYEAAEKSGRLPLRMTMAMAGGPDGIAEKAFAGGYITGQGSQRLRTGPIKFFTDGSAGGCTAAMREPYTNGDKGVLIFKDAELEEMVAHYHHRGYQVAIHAIGDAAIDQTLKTFEHVCGAACAQRRHRVEHCGFTTEDQIETMKRLGITPAPQPVFIRDFGDTYLDVVGEGRSAGAYPMARWQRRGLKPAMSSDTPVSDVNPFVNLHAALTRTTLSGETLGADERLTLAEALSAYTENGAFACGMDEWVGTLEEGKVADIAVLNGNPFDRDLDRLLETKADLTFLDGLPVYDPKGEMV